MTQIQNQLALLADCAAQKVLAKLQYRKPGEKSEKWRFVEPYALVDLKQFVGLRCWQLRSQPASEEGEKPGWKCLRVDRIVVVEPTAETFKPKVVITLTRETIPDLADSGYATGSGPFTQEAAKFYYTHLINLIVEKKLSESERTVASEAAVTVDRESLRAVHAFLFAHVLTEISLSGRMTQEDELYVSRVRSFLESLGWAP